MVVMADRDFFNDARMLPQGVTYIYTYMCDHNGGIHQLV
jgi:hypothetical protein